MTELSATDRLLATAYSVTRMLYQDRTWRPRGRPAIPLEAMSACHLRNVRGWLFQWVETLSFYADATTLSPWAPDDMPLITDEFDDPADWLVDTPLVLRIDALLEVDDYAAVIATTGPPCV